MDTVISGTDVLGSSQTSGVKKRRILVYTTLFPNTVTPLHGNFVFERIRHLAPFAHVTVIAPVPYFPRLKISKRWFKFSQVPHTEAYPSFEVDHPRYLVVPKMGMASHGFSMFAGSLKKVIHRLRQEEFDLIDAHYIYPDGFAATILGKLLQKPVVVSARGSDINLFPSMWTIRPMVRQVMRRADGLIAVSQSLKDAMVALGCPDEKIRVIGNGVDSVKFHPRSRRAMRDQLGLPRDGQIVLSVGQLIERKGFHVLIDAIARLRNRWPELILVIVGEGPYGRYLERRVRRHGLETVVRLVGPQPNDELPAWYGAADLFCLASSREGWANVMMEALACGRPVIATRVWGAPEIVVSSSLGDLVDRKPEAFEHAIDCGLRREWDTESIAAYARSRGWERVAREVLSVYSRVLGDDKNPKETS